MANNGTTVVMSTYNGSDTISEVLQGYTRLVSPTGGHDFVIVDNGSTDGTGAIIHGFKNKLDMKYVFEPRQGKNIALNTALVHVGGDLVLFTDDDAIPNSDWLVNLAHCAERNSDVSIFGGRILPRWPEPPPEWIIEHVPLGVAYALTPEHLTEGPVSPGLVWGGNMAVRGEIFRAGFRFDEAIGPTGSGNYVSGGEVDFTWRLAREGHKCWHCKGAIVQHIIGRHQFDGKWLLRRAYRFGRDVCNQQSKAGRTAHAAKLFGVPRWMIRRSIERYLRYRMDVMAGCRYRNFSGAWEAYYLSGYISQAIRFNLKEMRSGRRA